VKKKAVRPPRAADLQRAQQKAAELVLEDESWRNSLEDAAAKALLDRALAQMDAALAQAATTGTLTDELPYELAAKSRAVLARASQRADEPAARHVRGLRQA